MPEETVDSCAISALDYAAPAHTPGPSRRFALQFAAVCALLPMVGGTLVFAAWLATSNQTLPILGFLVIFFGCILCFTGVIALLFDVVRHFCGAGSPPTRWIQRGVVAFLLFANFPLAQRYMTVAQQWSISAVNLSGKTIQSFRVTDPSGAVLELGPIPANQSVRRRATLQGEGSVAFSADVGNSTINGTVEPYISGPDIGESRSVIINADGSHVVR